jgi:hypothetical protein
LDEDEKFRIGFKYAWDWFAYHADQRLKAFNFFLILVTALAIAYAQAAQNHLRVLGFVVGLLGSVVAIGFWIIDIRNEELVNCGRWALDNLEQKLPSAIRNRDATRAELDRTLDPVGVGGLHLGSWTVAHERALLHRLTRGGRNAGIALTHRIWLRRLELLIGLLFVGGAVWSLFWGPANRELTCVLKIMGSEVHCSL